MQFLLKVVGAGPNQSIPDFSDPENPIGRAEFSAIG